MQNCNKIKDFYSISTQTDGLPIIYLNNLPSEDDINFNDQNLLTVYTLTVNNLNKINAVITNKLNLNNFEIPIVPNYFELGRVLFRCEEKDTVCTETDDGLIMDLKTTGHDEDVEQLENLTNRLKNLHKCRKKLSKSCFNTVNIAAKQHEAVLKFTCEKRGKDFTSDVSSDESVILDDEEFDKIGYSEVEDVKTEFNMPLRLSKRDMAHLDKKTMNNIGLFTKYGEIKPNIVIAMQEKIRSRMNDARNKPFRNKRQRDPNE